MASVVDLKNKVLDKKELRNFDEGFLDKIIDEQKERNKKLYSDLQKKQFNPKSKEFDEFIKIIRKKIREVYGVFNANNLSSEKLQKLLEEFRLAAKDENSRLKKEIISKILSNHLSTSERIRQYPTIYPKLFKITGKPKRILDLGCGLNPLSCEFLSYTPYYAASDVSEKDLGYIKRYFEIAKIKGETIKANLTLDFDRDRITDVSKEFDVTLMFKLVDTLDSLKRGASEKLISGLQSKSIIISVPIYSISGRNRMKTNRTWLQRIINEKEKNGWKRTDLEIGNEHFTVLNK